MSMASTRIQAGLLALSACAMLAFIALFLTHNVPGLQRPLVTALLGVLYGAVFLGCALWAVLRYWSCSVSVVGAQFDVRLLSLALGAFLVYLFLDNTVRDYYQPISLFDDCIALLALSWLPLVLCLGYSGIAPQLPGRRRQRSLLILALCAVLGWPLMASLQLINQPNGLADSYRDVFIGGEDGYQIYRIPGMLVLPRGSTLADGTVLERDRLLAFAEARRDGALDTGAIDLVLKTSEDAGSNWGTQRVVCSYRRGTEQGKCGNATPLFNSQRGVVLLAYNLSGLDSSGHTAHIVQSDDGGRTWGTARNIASDNLVLGPGHGIQKLLPPHRGRLLLPAYTERAALLLYSDDHGDSWQRGQPLDTGNESEVAETSDGRLYITTRHRAPIGKAPLPNGRLYAYSEDAGASWSPTSVDTSLPTPVCQASVVRLNASGGMIFSNPAHSGTRVAMTVRYSPDDGLHWPGSLLVDPGPSGYSELALLSNGNAVLLYERGAMSYSERIGIMGISIEKAFAGK